MDTSTRPASTAVLANQARGSYAALRYQGVPPPRAQAFLGLSEAATAQLERRFLAQGAGTADAMKPRFARHAAHLRAVMAKGGFPVLPGRAR
jgi:hypothetical protein